MVRMLALDDLWTFSLVFILFREFGNKNSLIFGEDRFFFSLLDFADKNFLIFGEDLFFGLHLICLHEKNSGRASSI